MKTEIKAITPEQVGLTLAVLSGPRGEVGPQQDHETGKPLPGWPCIAYTCQLSDSRGRIVWTGPYKLGIGHVRPLSYDDQPAHFHPHAAKLGFTPDEANTSHHWKRNGGRFDFKDKRTAELVTSTAAKLAKLQNVAPKLDDVCHSLLSDGSAFFDGQRFEDWAGDLGYSADSIKAKETFEACDRIGRDLVRALSRDDLAGLREWASNY